MLLAKGADLCLAAVTGETPADLATDAETKNALEPTPTPGMKRKRSSGNNIHLEGSLPLQVDALYDAVAKKDLAAVRSLCVDSAGGAVAQWASTVAAFTAGTKHVSASTRSVHVDLTVGGAAAIHKLTFDDDGLITDAKVFRA
jgi:hypothetical protein